MIKNFEASGFSLVVRGILKYVNRIGALPVAVKHPGTKREALVNAPKLLF